MGRRPRFLDGGMERVFGHTRTIGSPLGATAHQVPGHNYTAFSSYPANVCIKYDTCFRQAVVRDKARSIPWDHLKEDLLVWCATRQPFRAFKPSGQGLNTARQTPTAPGATQSGARTLHVASGQEICRRYNFGNCARADCKFAHRCWTVGCGGDHPGKSCPQAAPAPPG